MWLEGLSKLKKPYDLIGTRTRDLPFCIHTHVHNNLLCNLLNYTSKATIFIEHPRFYKFLDF
jgi:hypothetical protein